MGEKKLDGHYTIAEYLELERVSELKHEYHNGRVYAFAGGSRNHGKIQFNVNRVLGNAIVDNNKPCSGYSSDVRIYIKPINSYLYPDTSVVWGEEETSEKQKKGITNPILVIEILSDSTKEYDRVEKFRKYRMLPSLQEYILIHQDKAEVETFYKGDDGVWNIGSVTLFQDETIV